MSKYAAPLTAILAAALTAFSGDIQGWVSAHPASASVFAAIGMIAAAFAPQPQK